MGPIHSIGEIKTRKAGGVGMKRPFSTPMKEGEILFGGENRNG